MSAKSDKSFFAAGVAQGLPFLLALVPFGLLFGVVGSEAGLNFAQVMGFSVLVIAGAAQFTAVQLMTENAPALVILATALAVNLRMAMYSAAMVPHIGEAPMWKRALASYFLFDQTVAIMGARFETDTTTPASKRIAFYLGSAAIMGPSWYIATFTGALMGGAIPPGYGLDMAMPVLFLSMIGPMLRTPAHFAAAFTSVVLALVLAFLPYNLGLMIAAVAAMAVGAEVERRMGTK